MAGSGDHVVATVYALPFPPQAADPQSPFVGPVGANTLWPDHPELCYSLARSVDAASPAAGVPQLATDGLVLDSTAAAAWLQAAVGNTNEWVWVFGVRQTAVGCTRNMICRDAAICLQAMQRSRTELHVFDVPHLPTHALQDRG